MAVLTLLNSTFESAPAFTAAQTADGWIDGTATGSATTNTYGWWASPRATAIAVQFDNTTSHSGTNSLKLSTTNTTGRARVFNVPASAGTVTAASSPYFIPVIGGQTYTLTGWCKTNNVAAAGAFLEIVEVNSSFVVGTSTGSNSLTGTNAAWTQLTATVTVAAGTAFLAVDMQNATAGNVSDAWFDDLVLTGPNLAQLKNITTLSNITALKF
jgi:hypothetical protein